MLQNALLKGVLIMKDHFIMFAAYNQWANRQLYAATEALSSEEFQRDIGLFFHSLCGTLNHLLVGDRIWMKRFTGEGDPPGRLDAVLYAEFVTLKTEREREDQRILDWIDTLDETSLDRKFTYRTITNPIDITQRLGPALAHFFNHQTHHRGQAHSALSLLKRSPPPLDLLYYFRTNEGRRFA
jgi:uncharacterized damage-inducible protein DinB